MAMVAAKVAAMTIHCTAGPKTPGTFRPKASRNIAPIVSSRFLPKVAQLVRCNASPKHPQSGTALVVASHNVSGSMPAIMMSVATGALRR